MTGTGKNWDPAIAAAPRSSAAGTPPFDTHRKAALALLNGCLDLTLKEAGFLGHCCVNDPLTAKQAHWLKVLLARHGLPPLAESGAE